MGIQKGVKLEELTHSELRQIIFPCTILRDQRNGRFLEGVICDFTPLSSIEFNKVMVRWYPVGSINNAYPYSEFLNLIRPSETITLYSTPAGLDAVTLRKRREMADAVEGYALRIERDILKAQKSIRLKKIVGKIIRVLGTPFRF